MESLKNLNTHVHNNFLISYYCRLPITFANSLGPDQNVWPELDHNCLTLMVFLKEFFEKVDSEKKQPADDKIIQ